MPFLQMSSQMVKACVAYVPGVYIMFYVHFYNTVGLYTKTQ